MNRGSRGCLPSLLTRAVRSPICALSANSGPHGLSTSRSMAQIASPRRDSGRLVQIASMPASAFSGLSSVTSFATVARSIGMPMDPTRNIAGDAFASRFRMWKFAGFAAATMFLVVSCNRYGDGEWWCNDSTCHRAKTVCESKPEGGPSCSAHRIAYCHPNTTRDGFHCMPTLVNCTQTKRIEFGTPCIGVE